MGCKEVLEVIWDKHPRQKWLAYSLHANRSLSLSQSPSSQRKRPTGCYFLWHPPSAPGLQDCLGHLSQSLLSSHYHSFLHSMKSLAQPTEGGFFFQLKVKSRNYYFFQTAKGYQTTVGLRGSQETQGSQITGHSDPGKKMKVIVCRHFSKKFKGTQSPLKTQFRKSVLDHVKNTSNYK